MANRMQRFIFLVIKHLENALKPLTVVGLHVLIHGWVEEVKCDQTQNYNFTHSKNTAVDKCRVDVCCYVLSGTAKLKQPVPKMSLFTWLFLL